MQQITPDFLASQLRVALVAILAYGGGRGWFTPADTTLALALMSSLGPLCVPWIWSIVSNLGTVRVAVAPASTAAAKIIAALVVSGALLAMLTIDKARASDNLPVKAAAPAPQAFGTSGGYFGIYTEAGDGTVNGSVAGVNSASLVTNQAGIGFLAGYAKTLAADGAFTAFEARFKVNNVNGSTPGFAWDGPIGFEQVVKLGLPLDKVLSIIPNLGLPTAAPFPVLPQGVALLNTKSYIMASVMEDDNSYAFAGLPPLRAWKASGAIGTGMIGQLSNGTALDVWAKMVFGDREVCFGAIKVCGAEGKKYMAGLAVDF